MEIAKYSSAHENINIYQDVDYEKYRESAISLKVSEKKGDSFEKSDFTLISESYITGSYDNFNMKAIGTSGVIGSAKNSLFYSTSSLMKNYYAGDIDEDGVKQQIYEYVKQYTAGTLEKDDHYSKVKISAVMSDIYEYLSRANSRQAVAMNQNAAKEYWTGIGVKDSEMDAYTIAKGTVYYDAKYYYKCESMQNIFRSTLDEIADQYGASRVEYDTVEKNTVFALDGGVIYNQVWNWNQLQTNNYWMTYEGKTDIVENDFVPQEGFTYAYTNGFSENIAKKLLDYIKGNTDISSETTDKKNKLLMELNYGKSSQKKDANKINEFLSKLNVSFLKSNMTNIFGDYFRMISCR